jgi:hypothetical protein
VTAYSGFIPAPELFLPPKAVSGNMGAMVWAPTMTLQRESGPSSGGSNYIGNIYIWKVGLGGNSWTMFDGVLFERIVTMPRTKSLGFVLSDQTFQVEVWNAHMQKFSVMTGITVAGGGGTTVANPGGTPLLFGPDQSVTFTVSVPAVGVAALRDLVTWVFTGELGADLLVTGSRLTPFSLDIDWSQGFTEVTQYKTAILKSWSDMEQRIQQRTVPRPHATFSLATMGAQESSYLDSLLWSWQHRVFGVPWWPDASILAADLSIGATSVTVSTTNKAYTGGGLIMLWKDYKTWEVMAITTLSAGSVSFASPTQFLWKAGTILLPLNRGRLANTQTLTRTTNFLTSGSVSFEIEVV